MASLKAFRIRLSLQQKFFMSIVLIIFPVLGVIFSWAGIRSERNATAQIINQARILARQIVLTRQWISDCGGVMVNRKSEGAGGIIYFLDDRLNTAKGTFNRFTPSMVTKKLSQYSMRENMYHFRLASLNPVNPENGPDPFEQMALMHFSRGQVEEVYQFNETGNQRTFRYIAPLFVDKACMECHQTYTEGTIGGCLSIFLPTSNIKQSLQSTYINLAAGGVAIILLTSLTLFFLLRRVVIKPVNEIKNMALQISGGNQRARVHLQTGDEFEQLGLALNTMGERLALNQDIMQQKIATATHELSQANQELKKLDRLKTEFIADMSHELRSPVTAIQGGLDYLKRRITKADNKNYLTIIDNNLLRLTHLISDMLDLTRIEAGKMTWHIENNDMAELIGEVIEILSLKARARGIAFDFNYHEPVWVEMDLERMEQVLVNLIENAIKFSRPDGTITIRTHQQGQAEVRMPQAMEGEFAAQAICVSVRDTGIGIVASDIETIFEKFHTLPSGGGSGRTKGTGLGLTICRKIIEAHQGRIWAESKQGQGSVFRFVLPRQQDRSM